MNYGNVLKANEREAEAIDQYRKALTLKPDYAECLNNLGIALAALSRDAEAREAYDRAIALRPEYPEAINNLANLRTSLGEFEVAAVKGGIERITATALQTLMCLAGRPDTPALRG